MSKYLIINSDDFGLSKSVNQGIMESFYNGTVSSATLMVNMPGFEDAVRLAKAEPSLGVGLHFNLSYGRPLTEYEKVPSLVDERGIFTYHPDDESVDWKAADVLTELNAQWDQFVSSGLRPTHIDSHHLIHALKPAYSVVAEFANQHNLPLRLTNPTPMSSVAHPITTDHIIADEYFAGDGKERLLKHISNLNDGITELMCHPGYVDDDVRQISPWTEVREIELKVFTDKEVAEAIEKAGIVRTNFSELSSIRAF